MLSFQVTNTFRVCQELFWIASFITVVVEGYQDMCKDNRHGVDSGLVRVPDFQDNVPPNVTCTWSFTAPPGRKLLVKVDAVHFPPQDVRDTTLKLVLDDEVIDIPRNCVRCLKQMVSGHSVKILYSSTLLSLTDMEFEIDESQENALYADAGSFQIRYKAFDPLICDKPRSPLNGQAVVVSRKLGHEVKYQCNPPYDLFGKTSAVCQIPVDSPVPDWSNGPPKCGISNCSNIPITRKIDSSTPGAIASPGYPNFKIHSSFDCEWIISTEPGYQLSFFLSFLELSDNGVVIGSLRLYDGPERTLLNQGDGSLGLHRNVTTRSNVLTVSFKTNNTELAEGGFYLNFNAISAFCPAPEIPENGEVVGYSFLVGSTIVFRCATGFTLDGDNQAECLLNGLWSKTTPLCVNESDSTDSNVTIWDQSINFSPTPFPEHEEDETTPLSIVSETASSELPETTAIPKVTKPSKKSKLPTSKIPLKSTIRPKPKPEVVLNEEIPTTAKTDERQSTEAVNGTVKEPKFSRPMENGILKTDIDENSKEVSEIEKNNKNKIRVSEDYLGEVDGSDDESDEIDDSDLIEPESEEKEHIGFPKAPASPSLTKPTESSSKETSDDISLMTTYIAVGVGTGCLLILLSIIATLIIYRKRFPVRMRFGRKFSTFENPMYVANKDQDAQHPRELKRLTV